ncbi:hypothetical protein BDZ89DRAFT_492786 [Hymenopellis radicata]|nr:hypothetical protein BDZ89DRAFT_492786 [Hymenopellis radicata]
MISFPSTPDIPRRCSLLYDITSRKVTRPRSSSPSAIRNARSPFVRRYMSDHYNACFEPAPVVLILNS